MECDNKRRAIRGWRIARLWRREGDASSLRCSGAHRNAAFLQSAASYTLRRVTALNAVAIIHLVAVFDAVIHFLNVASPGKILNQPNENKDGKEDTDIEKNAFD